MCEICGSKPQELPIWHLEASQFSTLQSVFLVVNANVNEMMNAEDRLCYLDEVNVSYLATS